MANITVTTNQSVIDVTETGGVNVTNTTDVITVLPSGTLIIQSPDTYSINASTVAGGANLNLVNSNGTTDAVKFASGTGITVSRTDADTITVTNTSPAGTTYSQTATAATGGANLNLVGSDATTDTVKFASGTNVTVTRTDADTITIASTDTNTTYTQNASSVAGGANLNLVGSDSTTDSVKFASGTNVTVTRTDADTITIASTDTNTTYDFAASSTTGGANFNLTGSDATTDTVKLTNGGYITATYTSGTEVTLGSNATDANTPSTIVARDASGNFSSAGATLGNITVGVATDQTIATTSGDLILDSTSGTIRVIPSQINSRNSTYTPVTIPLTAVTGLNNIAVASSTGGYFPDISVNNYLGDTGANNFGAGVTLRSTSGTSASPTGTITNQIIGSINFDGYAAGTGANWASYTSTVAGGSGGGVSYVVPLHAQGYARQAFATGTVITNITGASGNGTTATLTFTALPVQAYFVGQVVTVAGMTPSGYNGTYTLTAATTTSVSYLNATTGFTSGGTVALPVVSAAGTGFRIRGFGNTVPMLGGNRITFADFNAASTTFKSTAYTFSNEAITGATTYLTLGSSGSTFNQTTGTTTINNDLTVKGTGSNTILQTFNNAVFTQTPYAGVSYSFPLRISGKRTDNVNVQDDDNTSIQYQLFGSGSNFVNIGSQTMTYKTSGDNSIDFKLENNAGPSVTTTPMTISAPVTTIRAGTNASVSTVATFTTANTTLKADALTLQTNASVALVGSKISYNRVYGQFEYTTTVTPAATNTAYVFPLGTAIVNNIATVGSTSRLIPGAAGVYNLQFSAQVKNDNSQEHTAYIFLVKNGTAVTSSTGQVTILRQSSQIVSWNYLISSANTTDYFEIGYAVDDTQITFPAFASTAFAPSAASIITTLTPVGA